MNWAGGRARPKIVYVDPPLTPRMWARETMETIPFADNKEANLNKSYWCYLQIDKKMLLRIIICIRNALGPS